MKFITLSASIYLLRNPLLFSHFFSLLLMHKHGSIEIYYMDDFVPPLLPLLSHISDK